MLQPAACVLPSNAPPLRDGSGDNTVQHASRVLQEQSGNIQQHDYSATAVYEPKYRIPVQTGVNTFPSHEHFRQNHPQPSLEIYQSRARHATGYQHPDYERHVLKKAAELYKRFQDCAGYTKYRSRQQKGVKAGQEQKWPDHLEEAFFRALVRYPPMGRGKQLDREDKQRGRNEMISDYIMQCTGAHRHRKQVSSHIQVLKPFVESVPQIMRYLSIPAKGQYSNAPSGSEYSGRRMSTYPAASLPHATRSNASVVQPQAEMETVRKLKHKLNIFEPKKFEMFVQRKYELPDGQTQEERLHTYTQSIDQPLGDDTQLLDLQLLADRYPLLAAMHAQKPLDCNVVVADASIGFPSESFRDVSGVELGISFVCSSSHLGTEAKVRCRNSFYSKGQRLSEDEFDAPFQLAEDRQSVTTSLKFGSSFWARMLHQLAARLMREHAVPGPDAPDEVHSVLNGLTAMLEVIVVSPHGRERILVMSWSFRKSSVATGRASWKRLLMPQPASQYPDPTMSERVDSVYDYGTQYAELPGAEAIVQPALQSPFEYESSSGSALSSATWPTSATEGGLNVPVAGQTDFSTDNSFDFNAGSINLSYDAGLLDFSNFDSCTNFDNAAFDFGAVTDFTDPALDQYSQQWYDSFDTQAPLSAVSADTHYAPTVQMEGVSQVYGEYATPYEQQTGYQAPSEQQPVYQAPLEQQAYGGAGQDWVGEDALGALADASYMRSLLPKQNAM
ncbi:hypothetical protein LTR53_004863 [Teratosphaeriaceae sp. CCFEE 6253]|nr:hypothetical protein LTR53_004863 [Teratosphaeriaceae sp. CCFEE 6253]